MYDPRYGYPAVVPYVRYREPQTAITWLSAVLGAREGIRMTLPDGRIGHAELLLDRHVITLGLAIADQTGETPADRNAVWAMTLVFVPDVDAAAERAVKSGGRILDNARDMPWGLRQAIVADPEGHIWELSTHFRDVPLNDWGATQTGHWFTE